MSVSQSVVMLVALLLAGGPGVTDEPSAKQILNEVQSTYEALPSYQATGTIVVDMETRSIKSKQVTEFSIRLGQPNLYRITWKQTEATKPAPAAKQSGAVWNDGSGPFLYMSALNAYSPMESDALALGGATGISSGAAFTIPSLFLDTFKAQTPGFSRLRNVQIENSETIHGEDCYVISGSSQISEREAFWISKSSHLIRQYSRSLAPPEGEVALPEMTDEQIESSIEALGETVTEKRVAEMKRIMERMREQMKSLNLRGTMTETHQNPASPKLAEVDFQYSPPEGAEQKANMLGGMFGGEAQKRFQTKPLPAEAQETR